MVPRSRLALSLYTILYYAEILASFCIIFAAALPFNRLRSPGSLSLD